MTEEKIVELSKIEQLKVYISEAKGELKKIIWTEKKAAMNITWAVIAISIIVAVVLGVIDLIYTSIIKFIVS